MLKGMGRPGKKGIDLVRRVQKMRVSKERKEGNECGYRNILKSKTTEHQGILEII